MIELHDIEIGYSQRPLLAGVNLHFEAGELVALLGRNGSGKSTLLRSIAGLEPPMAGAITIDGADIFAMNPLERASTVSFVTTERRRVVNLLAEDLVALGRAPYTSWLGRMQEHDRDIVAHSLELVGMTHMARRNVDSLSDGELQRVMIARALAQQTPVILLDEPTAFLDMPSRFELVELLGSLTRTQGKTVIFSTHELDLAQEYCDTLALIDQGQIEVIREDNGARGEAVERIFNIRKPI
ncbi:MAG: ABC transporter ATP-binding protein [Rikenellaceae bacterium]